MIWRVARALDVLLVEINKAAPNRNKASDGSIGDAAHASRSSDHNPWVVVGGVGVVRARDFTHDPAGGLDCNKLADRLSQMIDEGTHPALGSGAYIIWQRRIKSRDRRTEGWRTYTGSNPHDKHLHLSVALNATGFDSLNRWGVMDTEEPDDMFSEKDRKMLEDVHKWLAAGGVVRAKQSRTNTRLGRANKKLGKLIRRKSPDA